MRDHLTPAARKAHDAMLDAFDKLMSGVLKAEGSAMEAKLRADGMSARDAAQGASEHVNRLLLEMSRERARLEAEAVRERH